jgi:uncharacterized membrane protein
MRHVPMPGASGMGILFGIAAFVATLLLIAIIVALVVYFVRRNKNQPGPVAGRRPPAVSALQILDERLASGQIEIDDYLNRKAALLGEPAKPTEWTPTPAPDVTPPPTAEQPEAPAKD